MLAEIYVISYLLPVLGTPFDSVLLVCIAWNLVCQTETKVDEELQMCYLKRSLNKLFVIKVN